MLRVQIKIAPEPFARGGLRKAYHMLDLDAAEDNEGSPMWDNHFLFSFAHLKCTSEVTYVAKMAIDPYEDREIYFQDVEMQVRYYLPFQFMSSLTT